MTRPPRILIATAETGGGHRAMSAAIRAALQEEQPEVEARVEDVFNLTPLSIFERTTRLYGPCIRYAPWLYGFVYHLGNRPAAVDALTWTQRPLAEKIAALIEQARPDVIVNTHPLANGPILDAAGAAARPVPVFASVSELVTVHRSWVDPRLTLLNTATTESFEYVRRWGALEDRVRCVGLPVHPRFARVADAPQAIRSSIGLDPRRTTALLVGGGEGAGGLEEVVREIDRARLPLQMIVVCGRNALLKERLEGAGLRTPARIYGFVKTMPELMRASDVVVTKGGPQTIAEALVVGRPVVVTQTLPGQEEGNGVFVESRGLGFGPASTRLLVDHIAQIVTDDALREWMTQNALRAGRPNAGRLVAQMIIRLAEAACLA